MEFNGTLHIASQIRDTPRLSGQPGCHSDQQEKYSQMTFTPRSIINSKMLGSGHYWLMGGIKIHFLFRPALSFTITIDSALAGPRYEDKEINILEIIHDFTILFPQKLVVLHHSKMYIMSSAIIMASHTARALGSPRDIN